MNEGFGTHFEGVTIEMPLADLRRVLGEPHRTYEPGGKVQYEWTFVYGYDNPVTVYDYKEYDNRSPREWHLGARRKVDALAFKEWFEGEARVTL